MTHNCTKISRENLSKLQTVGAFGGLNYVLSNRPCADIEIKRILTTAERAAEPMAGGHSRTE